MDRIHELRRIAVIGAGRFGLDFALRCVSAGCEVVLEDVMPSRLRRAQDAYAAHTALAAGQGPGTLRFASTVEEAVRHAELAIDSVPDELESKLEIFSLLDRMAPPHTILCTPTTALSIADLASCTYRSELCFGLRTAALDASAGSAELVHIRQSSPAALRSVELWLQALGFAVTTAEDTFEPQLVGRSNPLPPSR